MISGGLEEGVTHPEVKKGQLPDADMCSKLALLHSVRGHTLSEKDPNK